MHRQAWELFRFPQFSLGPNPTKEGKTFQLKFVALGMFFSTDLLRLSNKIMREMCRRKQTDLVVFVGHYVVVMLIMFHSTVTTVFCRITHQTQACSNSNASAAKPMPMAFTFSYTSVTISEIIPPGLPPSHQALCYSRPSKANSEHFSSLNVSVMQHCPSPMSVCTMCVCVCCVCVCVCILHVVLLEPLLVCC